MFEAYASSQGERCVRGMFECELDEGTCYRMQNVGVVAQ